MSWLRNRLKSQYLRTMREAYGAARAAASAAAGTSALDCGSGSGIECASTFGGSGKVDFHYMGLEWSQDAVAAGRSQGLDVVKADLNQPLPVDTESQDCVIAYSVLEHLLKPCAFLRECHRVLKPGGSLVVLTPNISTYFTAIQILLGQMPSSGPHPDSNELLDWGKTENVAGLVRDDVSADTPMHRHLVVFSYKTLNRFLNLCGFNVEQARGFGYYPLPEAIQPFFERIDPSHCHQMVFICRK